MTDSDKRAFAETVFEREQRREKEISSALKLEGQRHEAAVKTMRRLRELRFERDQKTCLAPSQTVRDK